TGTTYYLTVDSGGADDGANIATDDGDTADISLTAEAPDEANMVSAEDDWGVTSDTSDVLLYSALVTDSDGTEYYLGNFETEETDYVQYYIYLYASKECVISGTIPDGDDEYIFENVELAEGWNAVITETVGPTEDGMTLTYKSDTIDNAKWTQLH
ncbi:MAG: hypothetical protein ACOCWH_06270, partial [Spirochaetota bacterium]